MSKISSPASSTSSQTKPDLLLSFLLIFILILVIACSVASLPSAPAASPVLKELVLYNWVDYMPPSVLEAFTAEYGIKVTYLTYESTEEAVAQIRAGQNFDVAVVENDRLPALIADGFLAPIDYRHVPNFKNTSANFRDLVYDPDNKHSVPFNWGSTGLLVRSDLVKQPVTRWADLWDRSYPGKIAMRPHTVEVIGVALNSLGYPLNTEDPAALAAVQDRLLELKPSILFVETESDAAIAGLLSGEAVMMVGWPEDALNASSQNPVITYVLPTGGVLLWGESLVISAHSSRRATAELFLNFLLRPEISAQIVNTYYYPNANEAARPFIKPEIATNPIVFPPREIIDQAQWFLPLSPRGQKLYDQVWQEFITAQPTARKE